MKLLNNGFSLVEMLIVVALFALITLLGSLHTRFLYRAGVCSQLYHLHSVCWYLQQKAFATQQEQRLFLDPVRNAYHFNNTWHSLPQSIQFGFIPGVKGPPAHPTAIIQTPITFKSNTIVFYPDGIISSGSVYFCDKDHHSLYALTNAVAQVSLMRLYGYHQKWVLLV